MVEVRWTRDSQRDLDQIAAHIAQHHPLAAEVVVRRIADAVSGLSFYPRETRSFVS
jgi:plasmid stabilization system protein ParE